MLRHVLVLALVLSVVRLRAAELPPAEPIPNTPKRSVIFILADDHRYDALGFLGHPFLKTPHLDSLARNGAHLKNACVTTALCSPSRATILTGQYAHKHGVVDNNNPIPPGTVYFPQYLQKLGYKTAFMGKWHMGGEGDDPQPGFDRWISFRGQGTYLPSKNGLNIDGQRVPQKGYITDELTDYAVDWLKGLPDGQPFFLYLSHKAVHAEFQPAERHKGLYEKETFTPPPSYGADVDPAGRPTWVKNQRNSWHGVDYPYHSTLDIGAYYKRYCETLLAVDDSVGRVLETLKARGVLDSTLVLYMGDNGFAFGEHGLIDKRTAYEESMRVPLLAQCPQLIKGGTVVAENVANLDIAPTVLEFAGLKQPPQMQGRSFLPLLRGEKVQWRENFLYEYYWERNFPQTPTVFAVRGARYKYIRIHGVWDIDELYDLEADPLEMKNLIHQTDMQPTVKKMYSELYTILRDTGGMQMPVQPAGFAQNGLRRPDGAEPAPFNPAFLKEKKDKPKKADE